MKKLLLLFGFSMLIFSCNGQSISKKTKEKYIRYKNEFNRELTNQFPNQETSFPNSIVKNKDLSNNNVCFMLYEYKVDRNTIDSLISHIQNKYIAKYKSEDKCLLIVNRFDTFESLEKMEATIIKDSTKINQDCYKNLYPIPNFIDYSYPKENNELKLEAGFDIYILEAKSGNYFKEFELLPNPQMPKEWENGYSKGIAINSKNKTLIFWGLIW